MRILKITAGVAVIALAIAYIASPYAAASGFSSALANYDANEASEYIDYPSVRQKIKDDMQQYYEILLFPVQHRNELIMKKQEFNSTMGATIFSKN